MVARTKQKIKNIYQTFYQKKKYLHLKNWGKPQVIKLLNWFFTFICLFAPILIFYITESIVHDVTEDMNKNAQMLNIFLFELILFILFGLIGNLRAALITETVFFTLYAVTNYFVISFRSTPVQPWDFYSISTAASVAGDFKYTVAAKQIYLLISIAVLIAIFCFAKCKLPIKKFFGLRLCILGVSIGLFANLTSNMYSDQYVASMHLYNKLFTPTTIYYRVGGPLSFLMETKYLSVDVPKGYAKKDAKELLESYGNSPETADTSTAALPATEDMPNIICIMDEAFSDLSVLGDFETNMDYMPYIRSLVNDDHATTGYLNVSVVGGNTANSEFEFLTGNTMAFLPQGSVAYQQYVHGPIDCLPTYLKSLGYSTYAAHPFRAKGWSRNTVYPNMKFDQMKFLEDYEKGLDKVRSYISDQACFEDIIHTYEQNEATDTPFFMFLVTMQNHSSYTKEYDNFTPDVKVEGSDSFALSGYLSLMKKTDTAVENLLDYFSHVEKDTIIVFFGDHQPADSVVSDIYKINGSSVSKLSAEERTLRYKVPFFIWTNYEPENGVEHNVETSANYLAARMMATTNLPLSNYQNFLLQEEKEIPIVSAQTVVDAEGNTTSLTEASDSLYDYSVLQYYQMFDAKH